MLPSEDAVISAVEYYRWVLRAPGAAPPSLADMGPLVGLLVTPRGAWRAEGMAAIRRALLAGLTAWIDDDAALPRFTKGVSADDAKGAIERHWGLTSPPTTLEQAGRDLGRQDQTIANWVAAAIGSHAFRSAVGAGVDSDLDLLPNTPRPEWVPTPHAWLDPGSRAPGRAERVELADRLARLLDGTTLAGADATRVLRDHVSDVLMDEYLSPGLASLLRRSFRGLVLDPWFFNDPGSFTQLTRVHDDDRTTPVDDDQLVQLAAMVQMFAHDLVTLPLDPATAEETVAKLRSRAEIRSALLSTHNRAAGRSPSLRPPRSEFEFSLRRARGAADVATPLTPVEIRRSASIADDLDAGARAIRKSRLPSAKLRRCVAYLETRAKLDWTRISDADAIIIQVADHTVHLDLHRLGNDDLVRHLSGAIRATKTTRRSVSYRRLPDRIEALGLARDQRFDVALKKIEMALRESDALHDYAMGDAKALLESRQQLRLTGAGIAVRMAEASIAMAMKPEVDPLVSRCLEIADHYASTSLNLLAELDSPDIGLGAVEDEDPYISAAAWRSLPRIVGFRVHTAALVAAECGLLRDVAFPIPTLEILEREYIETMSLPDVREDDALETIRAALWLAFLAGGSLPAVPALSLERAGFLDVPNAAGVTDWEGLRVELRVDQIDSLFKNLEQDPGAISKIEPEGRAAGVLGSRSPDFPAWLANARPEPRKKIGLARP